MGYISQVHNGEETAMATRSRIGFQLKDGSIVSSYHHWDGYPTGLGQYLVDHYTNVDDVRELIDGGDMSTCMKEDGPEYYVDRGDRNTDPQYTLTFEDFITMTEECWGEYGYVFVNGSWTCYDVCNNKYVSLYQVAA